MHMIGTGCLIQHAIVDAGKAPANTLDTPPSLQSQVLAQKGLLLQIVYAVRAKTTLAVDLKNVEENGAKTMAKAFQVRFVLFTCRPCISQSLGASFCLHICSATFASGLQAKLTDQIMLCSRVVDSLCIGGMSMCMVVVSQH